MELRLREMLSKLHEHDGVLELAPLEVELKEIVHELRGLAVDLIINFLLLLVKEFNLFIP